MKASVVVRSKDEADRLRLTLASLARQSAPAEVVVVNDGSSDHTDAVIKAAAAERQLTVVRHERPRGRSGAANAGARAATGDILIFLDGDTLAGPEMVGAHLAAHAKRPGLVARGPMFHLRCTRFLKDPETGAPRDGEAARIQRLPASDLAKLLVTRRQIAEDFAAIERRAELGLYPGEGPRRLQALEMAALTESPDCAVLWAAASGSNLSAPREAVLACGGFDERIELNEHRELALRLCEAGLRMVPAAAARAYHLTHRSGWRDPLADQAWERLFWAKHPRPEVKLLAVFWASLGPAWPAAPAARIHSLAELEAAARQERDIDYDAVRRALGLQELTPPLAAGAPA